MSFSSTTSRVLRYVLGTFYFTIPALQLALVLSGKKIQMLLREQRGKQPVQPHEPHILGKLLVSVAERPAPFSRDSCLPLACLHPSTNLPSSVFAAAFGPTVPSVFLLSC